MRRRGLHVMVRASALAALLGLWGCGEGPPSVSSSQATANVHGTVKIKGVLVPGGEIRFDPANVQRRDAKQATAPIGKDGTYKITTLVGGNMVLVSLPPEILKQQPKLATFMMEHDVPSGDSALDVDLDP